MTQESRRLPRVGDPPAHLRFPSAVPVLEEGGITLRELGEEDIPAWFARATDLEAADLAGDPVPASIDLGQAWLQRQRDHFRRRTGIRWAIVPDGSPVSIGTVGLTLLAGDGPVVAELGIVLARPHWGRGIGTMAARMAVRFGLLELGIVEVRAEVLARHPASMRMLAKAGFQRVRLLPPLEAEPEAMVLYAVARGAADDDREVRQPALALERWQSLDAGRRKAVLALHIPPQQVEFAGSIERAIAACESASPEEVAGLALLEGAAVVGFVVLSRGSRRPVWAPPDAVALTAMRIDARQQGRGLGKASLALVAAWLRRHWPAQATLALCVDEENHAGRRAYAAAGFTEYQAPRPGRIGMVRYLARPLAAA